MTPLQKEYIQYVRKIAYIDGLLQSMLSHIAENNIDVIKECLKYLNDVDSNQTIKFEQLINQMKK
jgi:hypothetical protein